MRFRTIACSVVAFAFLPACFALFSLDDYGPPIAEIDATSEASDAPVDVDTGPPKRIVFLTSALYAGSSLKSAADADAICAELATSAQLPGKFHAWTSDAVSAPASRIPALAAVYMSFDAGIDAALGDLGPPLELLDGKLVATDYFDLVRSGPRNGIIVTEKQTTIDASVQRCEDVTIVWTNTTRLGMRGGADCDNWTNPIENGRAGIVGSADAQNWTDACGKQCSTPGRLICFQE